MYLCCPPIQAKDPRLKITSHTVEYTDLTESGVFSDSDKGDIMKLNVVGENITLFCIFKCSILSENICGNMYFYKSTLSFSVCAFSDCADEVLRYYGEIYSCDVPRQAEFLEFTGRGSVDQPQVLWNRTDPQTSRGGRGQVRRNVWEMKSLTFKDSGHYSFRAKDNRLLSRKRLTVQGDVSNMMEAFRLLFV